MVTLTSAGVLGSCATLAPELLRGGARSPQADLYAAGATLFQLLAGQHYVALEGKGPLEAAEAIQHHPPRLPHPRIPDPLAGLVGRALAKDPAGRFASAAEMREALEDATPGPRGRRAPGAPSQRPPAPS